MSTAQVIPSYRWANDFVNKVSKNDNGTELSEFAERVAKSELREDKQTREQMLDAFRDWIAKNPDIKNINTDSNFLLRFLRVKKFSLPMAQDMLLKYLNLRQTFRPYFYNLDYLSPSINQLIDEGYLFASPNRDKLGRRVIFGHAANLDPYKHSNVDFAKIHILTYEALLCDEVTQVTGVVHFGNCLGVSPAVITYFSPKEFYTLLRWGEQSVPMRHKEFHFINVPTPLKYIYEFFQSTFSEKIRSRFMMHHSLNDIVDHMDIDTLPKEYGGTIPMADMIEMWKSELLQKRERLLSLDKMVLLNNDCVTKKKYSKSAKAQAMTHVTGSFRKLNID
ncbi:clavesin-2 isoform X2 [Planococcus citri]